MLNNRPSWPVALLWLLIMLILALMPWLLRPSSSPPPPATPGVVVVTMEGPLPIFSPPPSTQTPTPTARLAPLAPPIETILTRPPTVAPTSTPTPSPTSTPRPPTATAVMQRG